MLPHFVVTFDHELVSTLLISLVLAVLAWPVKKVSKAYTVTTSKLDAINQELKAELDALKARL